jgi:hypothetical protein
VVRALPLLVLLATAARVSAQEDDRVFFNLALQLGELSPDDASLGWQLGARVDLGLLFTTLAPGHTVGLAYGGDATVGYLGRSGMLDDLRLDLGGALHAGPVTLLALAVVGLDTVGGSKSDATTYHLPIGAYAGGELRLRWVFHAPVALAARAELDTRGDALAAGIRVDVGAVPFTFLVERADLGGAVLWTAGAAMDL